MSIDTNSLAPVTKPVVERNDFVSPQKKVSKTSPSPNERSVSASPKGEVSTPDGKVDLSARALNLSLEAAFLFTLRQEARSDSLYYIRPEASMGELINVTNISVLIFSRLSESQDISNAVSYLTGCYKRLLAKESSSTPKVQEDLAK